MNKYDLLEAMGGIRDEYIKEASQKEEETVSCSREADSVPVPAASQDGRSRKGHRRKILRAQKWAASLAAILCLSILIPNLSPGASGAFGNLPLVGPYFRAVTFRAYEYQDAQTDVYVEESQIATMTYGNRSEQEMSDRSVQNDADAPVMTAAAESAESESAVEDMETEESAEAEGAVDDLETEEPAYAEGARRTSPSAASGAAEDSAGFVAAGEPGGAAGAGAAGEPGSSADAGAAGESAKTAGGQTDVDDVFADSGIDYYDETAEAAGDEADPSVLALLSASQITEEIRQRAAGYIASFERSIEEETGFYSLRFLPGTVTDTADWFCMRVLSYTASADGFEQVTHFVIDKESGRRVSLADWFGEDVDYITPISENIKEQMRRQMAESNVDYWLDSVEEPESDFRQIREDQDFYFNDDGELVICFDEMEVAPAYMGAVEFTIPREVTDSIRAGGSGSMQQRTGLCRAAGL